MTEVVLLGCGDVRPIHEPMERYSELVRDTLAGADIRFAQVERTYSERGVAIGPAPFCLSARSRRLTSRQFSARAQRPSRGPRSYRSLTTGGKR